MEGIVRIAEEKNISNITTSSVLDAFLPLIKNNTIDMEKLRKNLNQLLDILPVSVSELSKFLNYDASYISRIRNGLQQPSDPQDFVSGVRIFVIRRCYNRSQKEIIADLIGCKSDDFKDPNIYQALLAEWLTNGTGNAENHMKSFLVKLDHAAIAAIPILV